MYVLSNNEIKQELNQYPLWELKEEYIYREFKFSTFHKAILFINKVAAIAEEQKHHPVITNSYSTVEIKMHTHDAGGITKKDFALALAINQIEL
ncbi:MAG: 4a-hydroxytetrahydrobiopterin dehydratase [Flavobacteriaceae bacterium]|jgi:4a-hydroxytetrahydrobiopterin dehydratase|nr:4a-hydroxytetrahydrobiopterin dehydratase [Flavobacteriaceae bacterium]MDB4263222.1 4a-hydroxytetrahydrobiopterin dehydratase [Flavobacteriaceae bacterium]MDC1542216.1 4a-hydroxytetrahydrobiopterin dehydratase [Flavobacteriaceae bacterium]MDC3214968.1 4a-hydroxytetrahydrobiopterin dehydratase [Flavobacteriaceae bacterium]MDG1140477.1 4a-hydroxytetrahydrobiopterin dehydratase [Flavobacteriaceae bacterium]|tara:strand:- start:174 stop:455 length:282 start_codon:yes stop_codon:yes gene_type:complete